MENGTNTASLAGTVNSIGAAEWLYIKKRFVLFFLIFGGSIAFCFLGLMNLMNGFPVQISLLPLILVIFITSAVISKKARDQFMSQIAASLGYSYSETGSVPSLNANLFLIGHGQKIANVISGNHNNLPTRIYIYSTTVGSGKNQHTERFTVFETTYPYSLPHILLQNLKNSFLNQELSMRLGGGEHIKLEGDFNKYFNLYAPKGLEIETLEIFTPDIMAYLIDDAGKMSFEFCDDKLYIYKEGIIGKKDQLLALYAMSEQLTTMLVPHLKEVGTSTTVN